MDYLWPSSSTAHRDLVKHWLSFFSLWIALASKIHQQLVCVQLLAKPLTSEEVVRELLLLSLLSMVWTSLVPRSSVRRGKAWYTLFGMREFYECARHEKL